MSNQSEAKLFSIRSSLFDRPRQLTIDPDFMEFEDNNLVLSTPTKFLKEDIQSIRCGVAGVRGVSFYIGRIYSIDIKSIDGRVIKIRIKTIYRIGRKLIDEKYSAIIKALNRCYFSPMARQYLQAFQGGQPIEILCVQMNEEGVLFDVKIGRISWNFLGTKKFRRYYSLFLETDPNQYKAFEYLHHWNALLLHSVVEGILKYKFPARKD